MWIHSICFLSLLALCELSITFPKSEETNETLKQAEEYFESKSLQHHVAALGLKTLSVIPSDQTNVILSPLNIYTCLGILGLGSSGETKNEISKVLGPASSNNTINAIINIMQGVTYASAAFLDNKYVVKTDFLNASLRDFNARVVNINFTNGDESTSLINGWVSENTNGTIPYLLDGPLPSDTKAVIVSALFFHGKWLHPFFQANTKIGLFKVDDQTSVEVPLMALEASLPIIRARNFNSIGLPYDGNDLTMHLILPRTHGKAALNEVLQELDSEYVKQLKQNASMEEVIAIVPKFKFDGKLQLKEHLKKQGLIAMFSREKADFSNLVENDVSPTYVSEIYHNVHFEMDEEGTSAAAVSAAIFTKSSKFVFRATRPFIFLITHDSGLVLFTGVITKPSF